MAFSFDEHMTPTRKNSFFDNVGKDSVAEDTEDVSIDWTEALIRTSIGSKLAWADTLRNVAIVNDMMKVNPHTVVELGCGNYHPVGKMIAGHELDAHYIGIDARVSAAENVSLTKGKNAFAGIAHDLSKGVPLKDECADYVICLEAMEHFCETLDDVEGFFAEVKRISADNATFWLATPNPAGGDLVHPHCHDNEFNAVDLLDIIENTFGANSLIKAFNYRLDSDEFDEDVPFSVDVLYSTMPPAFARAVNMFVTPFDANKRGNVVLQCAVNRG